VARAQEIAAQTGSLKELGEIVAAIRVVAAAQMQQSARSLDAVRGYVEIIRDAVAEAASLLPADDDAAAIRVPIRPGLVVFGAEHGFCGAFNEPLIRTATEESPTQAKLMLIFVGNRGAQRSTESGHPPDVVLPMATHTDAVSATARLVAAEVYGMFVANVIDTVEVLYTREVSARTTTLQRQRLLPLEPSPVAAQRGDVIPIVNLNPERLHDELAAEYMFAMLEAATLESFASENAARFHAMEAAHENISRKKSDLDRLAHRMRQEAVTAEILEIIAGTEAMNQRR
jgi:F-type H+-transporting ATPase subunit gamma